MSGVARRLGSALAGVFASTVFVFAVLRVLPGDIATARLGTDATPEALSALREQYGLNRSLFAQYIDWLGDALRGDLGSSLVTGDSVRSEIFSRLDVTVPLVALSSLLAVLALSLAQSAILVRFARSQSLDFVASDAYRTARAAGRTADQALSTATRLVLSPVLTVTALQLSTLLTGAVVVETVFALPGLGSMTVRDIANRDVTKVQSTLLVLVATVFVIRLVIESVNDRLDPRRSA